MSFGPLTSTNNTEIVLYDSDIQKKTLHTVVINLQVFGGGHCNKFDTLDERSFIILQMKT